MVYKFMKLINALITAVLGFVCVVFLIYSVFILYDNFSVDRNAFVSVDLLQYKPVVNLNEDVGFQELKSINDDVIGWLTIYDTHIDYPVLQGVNDLEYVNKDAYGEFSMSGSIYLASQSSSDFSDDFSLIYGHHMNSGAMFGDIDKFSDSDFFKKHRLGLLQTLSGNYDLYPFACVYTDAYESLIYNPAGKSYFDLKDYIRNNAITYDVDYASKDGKIIALSTCASADTNGRLVLFVKAIAHLDIDDVSVDDVVSEDVRRTAVGHSSSREEWAFINAVCVLYCFCVLFPLGHLRLKYRQLSYSKRRVSDVSDLELKHDLSLFVMKMRVGLLLELFLTVFSVFWLIHTESFLYRMVMIDKWTPVMLVIAFACWCVDFVCFRYRGKRTNDLD